MTTSVWSSPMSDGSIRCWIGCINYFSPIKFSFCYTNWGEKKPWGVFGLLDEALEFFILLSEFDPVEDKSWNVTISTCARLPFSAALK